MTITLADDLDKKIRIIQAKKIQQIQSSYSFSSALSDVLRKGLKS